MSVRSLLALPFTLPFAFPLALSFASAPAHEPVAAATHPDAGVRSHGGIGPSDTIPGAVDGYTLTVVLKGASEDGGKIGAALFDSPDHFLDNDRATQLFERPRTAPVDSFVFTGLEAGEYAIAAFHDANGNGKLDKHWFGAPKESWGTSGDVRPRMRAPRFDEARVEVAGDVRVEIEVKR